MRGEVPAEVRRSMELWVGCVAGALEEREFEALLREVGFEAPTLEPTRIYEVDDARQFLEEAGLDVDAFAGAIDGRIMSAFVRATKPMAVGHQASALIDQPSAFRDRPLVAGAEPALAEVGAKSCCGPECCG